MTPDSARRPIDVHAHYYPERYLALIRDRGAEFGAEYSLVEGQPFVKVREMVAGPLGPRFIDLDARLAAMDEQGVAVHLLSLTHPMVYWAGRALAHALSEAFNDALAEAHGKHPQRLHGLAMVPMSEPDLAIRELDRAAGLPGIRGVYMATAVRDRELSDESLFPVYERIEALGLPVFLHPVSVIGHQRLAKFYLSNLLGNPFESAIAAAHLVFGGVLDRFSSLVVVLPHAGGAFPYLVGRLQRGWQKRPELRGRERGPMDYLRRFYYDTIGYAEQPLDYLVRLVGADRVMMGSDFCFPIAYERPVEVVTGHPAWAPGDQAMILEGNARRLLRL